MARLSVLVSALLIAAAPLGLAQAQGKIAVVNVQVLQSESPQGKALQQSFASTFGPRRRELETMQKDLQARNEKLQRDSAVMAENERRAAEKELRDKASAFQLKGKELEDDARAWQRDELKKLDQTLRERISAFARANGYEVVLPLEVTLYYNDAIDVTAQVLASLAAAKPAAAATPKPAAPPAKP